jgi:hypothetical protein
MAVFNIPGTIPSFEDLTAMIPIGVSPLGTPVFDDITFLSGSYYDENDEKIQYQQLALQAVQIVVNQQKEIIRTTVSGKHGTIKEYICQSDYLISINGKLSELANVMPYDQMEIWKKISESNKEVEVLSKILNLIFDINTVVITKFQITTIPGSVNEVDVSIELEEDIPFDFSKYLVK